MFDKGWLKSYIFFFVAPLLAAALLIGFVLFARIKGDLGLLDCERLSFAKSTDYYTCVQTRETVRIRELLESYPS